MQEKRTIVGFILAPFPTLIPLLLLFGAILLDQPPDRWNVIKAMLQIVLLSYGACLLIGAPVHFWLRHTGKRSLSAYLGFTTMGVFLAGLIVVAIEKIAPTTADHNPFGLTIWSQFGLIAMFGFAALALPSAFLFWYIAIRPLPTQLSASGRRE